MLSVDTDWKAVHGLISSSVSERSKSVTWPTKSCEVGYLWPPFLLFIY